MNRVEVHVASLLHSYTRGAARIDAAGATLSEVLEDLDRRFPGIRFRIVDEQDRLRPHVRFFVNGTDARDIETPLSDGDEVYIVGALSGGSGHEVRAEVIGWPDFEPERATASACRPRRSPTPSWCRRRPWRGGSCGPTPRSAPRASPTRCRPTTRSPSGSRRPRGIS